MLMRILVSLSLLAIRIMVVRFTSFARSRPTAPLDTTRRSIKQLQRFLVTSCTLKRPIAFKATTMCQAPYRPPAAAAAGALHQEVRQQMELMSMSTALTVGGHRGMGENLVNSDLNRRTYRENTVASFRRAASAGASFVEFDVQVTEDGVPVIWHDDHAVWRTPEGTRRDALISELTLSQFKQLSSSNCTCSLSTSPQPSPRTINGVLPPSADSCTSIHRNQQPQLLRAFHDQQGLPIGDGPSDWACSVDDELPTLAEVFARVPEHVGFDIEIKMTTPASMERTPPVEVDRIVSAVLGAMAYMGTSSRTLMFSSFDPCVCAALRSRQQRIPVLFLSTGGACWHASPLRTSLEAAVTFALETGLQGLVVDTSQLQKEPHIVATARSKGLQVLTYGLGNNDPSWIQQQGRLGVAAAIVDDVDNIAPLATAKKILLSAAALSSKGRKQEAGTLSYGQSNSASQRPAAHFDTVTTRAMLRQET